MTTLHQRLVTYLIDHEYPHGDMDKMASAIIGMVSESKIDSHYVEELQAAHERLRLAFHKVSSGEELKEFESIANKVAIERQHEMEKAQVELLEMTRKKCQQLTTELCREQEKLKMSDEKQVRENFAFLLSENKKLEAKCAEMRELLTTKFPGRNWTVIPTEWQEWMFFVRNALSSDCGKHHVHVRELNRTKELLKDLSVHIDSFGRDEIATWCDAERARLEALEGAVK